MSEIIYFSHLVFESIWMYVRNTWWLLIYWLGNNEEHIIRMHITTWNTYSHWPFQTSSSTTSTFIIKIWKPAPNEKAPLNMCITYVQLIKLYTHCMIREINNHFVYRSNGNGMSCLNNMFYVVSQHFWRVRDCIILFSFLVFHMDMKYFSW